MRQSTNSTLAQPFWPVKSNEPITFGTPPNWMIHHKDFTSTNTIIYRNRGKRVPRPYGLSSLKKSFTPELLLKKGDQVYAFLRNTLRLPPKQIAVAQALLTFQAYYPHVYPKASQIAESAGVSIPTVWRAVQRFEDMNLLEVVDRFLIRAEAQISNLYLLKNFVLVIIRYLAEHGIPFLQKWLTPILTMPAREFYRLVFQSPGIRAGPSALAL